MTAFQSRTEATHDNWQTPLHIIGALGAFDLDPCAATDDPTRCAPNYFTKAQNGLAQTWAGRVWLNPPYGADCKVWMRKLAKHGDGIALIPPRLGSKWFHDDVLPHCSGIYALRGRVSFIDPATGKPVKGNNADSVLIAYGDHNVAALTQSGLPGRLL